MNAKEARNVIRDLMNIDLKPEYKEAFKLALIALRHEEKMERIADLEATPEKVTLTVEDLLYIKVQTDTIERLLHHLPDNTVDHIGFICDAEMKDRYARREKMEKECEA